MSPAATDSFLLDQFREFYTEVVRLKERVTRDTWVYASEEGEEPPEAAAGLSPTAVWQRLLALLEQQALTARRKGGEFGEQFYREAQYMMAALADDIFVHLPWRGRESWTSNLLESKLFKTHRAGEAAFGRIDAIVRGRDPIHLDLAKLYLLALALGFQGQYRGTADGARQLVAYRQQLLEFISERDPALREPSGRLLPEAYASTVDRGTGEKLPYLRRWLLAYPVVLAVWILAGWWLWSRLLTDLRPLIARILGQV